MIPFSVDILILDMRSDMDSVKKNITKSKFEFCNAFEKELGLQPGTYSQDVYDYIFCLFEFRKVFGDGFKSMLQDLKDNDFRNIMSTSEFIKSQYPKMLLSHKKYFMEYFDFSHEDPYYMTQKFQANKSEMVEKLIRY